MENRKCLAMMRAKDMMYKLLILSSTQKKAYSLK